MKETVKYFAYGSNLNLVHVLEMGVVVYHTEKAVLKDYKLSFNVRNHQISGAGYANILPCKGETTEGLLIYTDIPSLKYLDEYEAFPNLYGKIAITVTVGEGKIEDAMAYIGNKNRIAENLKPTRSHLSDILVGKKYLSRAYFKRLKKMNTI